MKTIKELKKENRKLKEYKEIVDNFNKKGWVDEMISERYAKALDKIAKIVEKKTKKDVLKLIGEKIKVLKKKQRLYKKESGKENHYLFGKLWVLEEIKHKIEGD